MKNKVFSALKNLLSKKYPELAEIDLGNLRQHLDPSAIAEYAELPSHVISKAKAQFTGSGGLKNLYKGLGLGGGLSGISLGSDYLRDKDLNIGRASTLGSLGAIAPALLGGGRAGARAAIGYAKAVKNLNDRGVSVLGKSQKIVKTQLARDLLGDKNLDTNLYKFVKDLITKKTKRNKIKKLMLPGKEVEIDYLNNSSGDIDSMMPHLAAMAKEFGRDTLHSGYIINPNIAHRSQPGGVIPRVLKSMGYKRMTGETAPTKTVGSELNNALTSRLYEITGKKNVLDRSFSQLSDAEKSRFLPTKEDFFPFTFNKADGTAIRLTGSRMPAAHKEWMASQGVSNNEEYAALASQIRDFLRYSHGVAMNNPEHFATGFKLPSLRHFHPSMADSTTFDYVL